MPHLHVNVFSSKIFRSYYRSSPKEGLRIWGVGVEGWFIFPLWFVLQRVPYIPKVKSIFNLSKIFFSMSKSQNSTLNAIQPQWTQKRLCQIFQKLDQIKVIISRAQWFQWSNCVQQIRFINFWFSNLLLVQIGANIMPFKPFWYLWSWLLRNYMP